MKKNEEYEIEIIDYTVDGEGVGKVGVFPLFVKDTCVGDFVKVGVTKVKKTFGYARLIEVLKPSVNRIESPCEIGRQCGGCQLMQMSFEAENEWKRKKVENALERIGGIHFLVPPLLFGKEFGYRNKAVVPFGISRDGEIIAGFYAGRTHSIIPLKKCLLTPPEFDDIMEAIRQYAIENQISVYEEESKTGVLRRVLIRKGFHTGEVLVCLVIQAKSLRELRNYEDLVRKIRKTENGFTIQSVTVNFNSSAGNAVLGERTEVIFGEGQISDTIGGLSFRIHPKSFYQVNPEMTERLYETALSFADLKGTETVFDLYCGIGTISLFMAKKAKKVYGIEIVSEAVENARENARINQIENVEFFVGKAEEELPEWVERHPGERIDVICVDPPRKGCDENCLSTMLAIAPEKIVYVSCDPATLARDLKMLIAGGYELKKVQPVNQFGRTVHVECVVLLSRV